jgi:hypothetical protein
VGLVASASSGWKQSRSKNQAPPVPNPNIMVRKPKQNKIVVIDLSVPLVSSVSGFCAGEALFLGAEVSSTPTGDVWPDVEPPGPGSLRLEEEESLEELSSSCAQSKDLGEETEAKQDCCYKFIHTSES